MLEIDVSERRWPMREPFVIARGVQTEQATIIVTLTDDAGRSGRGEACGVPYAGETPASMAEEIANAIARLAALQTREELLDILPPGGARCAVDAALWDLEAKRSGVRAAVAAGVGDMRTLNTAYTIGIRDFAGYEATAARYADYRMLKIKVDAGDPLGALHAVRRGAPLPALIVDPNQSWSVEQLKSLAPALRDLGVVLLEQPIPVGAEAGLDDYSCPVALCADELINDHRDLRRAENRFDVINIKLDKTGGLTEALRLADEAAARGFRLMVGCMAGSSLSMAPAIILGQLCDFVDLDGPLLQSEDWPDGLVYDNGQVSPPASSFWG